jgi:hypothetical protein
MPMLLLFDVVQAWKWIFGKDFGFFTNFLTKHFAIANLDCGKSAVAI